MGLQQGYRLVPLTAISLTTLLLKSPASVGLFQFKDLKMIWSIYYAALGIACAVAIVRGFESD